ncbi:MAG: preprotein translocase subunit SecE [Clostridia bacterium]|nr:preprotein translocase subunit SecE [Clostridia bacterium]
MAKNKFIRVALVALMTIALVISVSPICAFATDDTVATDTTEENVLLSATPDTSETADSSDDVELGDNDVDMSDLFGGEDTDADTATGTDTGAVDTDENTDENATEVKDKGLTTGDYIGIAIVAVIVIGVVIFVIKNREKVAKFFREVKSEIKKIVWSPWKQVKKNLIIFIIIAVICAVVIGVLDYIFDQGILKLSELI